MTETTGPEYVEESGGEWQFLGSRCESCGAVYFPRATACAACGGRTLVAHHLGGSGTVYAKTTVGLAPPGFDPPYGLAWVDLPDGPRAFGQLDDPDNVEIGDRVEIVVRVIRHQADGAAVLGHAFRKTG